MRSALAARRHAAFASLWAVCVLYSFMVRSMADRLDALLVVAAVGIVLARPSSSVRVLLLAVAQVAFVAIQLDRRHPLGHQYFVATVHLVYIGAWVACAARDRRVPGPSAVLLAFAPSARVVVLLALFAAGFGKLNAAFVDPSASCGVALYLHQREVAPMLMPDAAWARWTAIVLPILGELGVALMLPFRRLRRPGLLLLFVFFFFVGVNPVNHLYEFAGPVVVTALLFVPLGLEPSPPARLQALGEPARLVGIAVGLGLLAWLGDTEAGHPWRLGLGRASWVVGLPLVAAWVLLRPAAWREAEEAAPRRGSGPRALLLIPLLFLLNETLPYLGFERPPSFTMASMVSVKRGAENHLLLTAVPPLDGNRVVHVRESSDRWLSKLAGQNRPIVFLRLRDHLAQHPEASVRFEVDGRTHHVERAGDDPRFVRRPLLAHVVKPRPLVRGWKRVRRCVHWPDEDH